MTRLVTYGCSFTNYYWPTWADILAENLDVELINRGESGSGNNFQFYRLQHDIKSGLIKKDDMVRIMWCSFNRVSEIIDVDNFKYTKPTNRHPEIVENFYNNNKIIIESQKLLKDHDYEFMSWTSMKDSDTNLNETIPIPQQIKNFQIDEIFEKPIHPPLVDVVMGGDFSSRTDYAITFFSTPSILMKNLIRQSRKNNLTPVQLIRREAKPNDGRYQVFFDYHPTPVMHLEYLQAIYPQMSWQPKLLDKIYSINQEVLNKVLEI